MTARLTLRPSGKIPNAIGFDLARDGCKIGRVYPLTSTLWVAAIDAPPLVIHAPTLRELRENLPRLI